jgi:hypothetical protein
MDCRFSVLSSSNAWRDAVSGHSDGLTDRPYSPKSYGLAVALCGIFGTLGVHHFYLGNWLHGLFDVGLAAGAIFFFLAGAATDNFGLIALAFILVIIDWLHTVIIFYRLIIGEQRDAAGLTVTFRR